MSTVSAWVRALRVEQWAKNLLVLVPLLCAHDWGHRGLVAAALIAAAAMCLAASAVYLVNDLVDRERDRHHPTKRDRPLAAGAIAPGTAMAVAAVLALGGVSLGWAASRGTAIGVAGYLAATTWYSLHLRRVALLDIFALAGLYTLRLVVGSLATGIELSSWLAAFSLFVFLSLSCAKRHAELRLAETPTGTDRFGRDYRPADAPLLLALGTATAVASAVILAIYLFGEVNSHYQHPAWLYPALPLELLWICRLWLFAGRGRLDLDPIAFALRDAVTLIIAVLIVVLAVLAA